MASDQSYVDYVCEQIADAGVISHRKMFGEYAVYCNEKVVALVCDNQLFVKLTDAGRSMLGDITEGLPYPGAKPWIVGDEYLEDVELITKLIRITADALPAPAIKKPKKKSAKKVAKKK
ncbi:MAG TPA: TfoX/Sxy family protein [Steroidobacteraceae bacterium]|nr:TfoX/Sxy family protein [Steroidobacteraceae bacterium]